MNIQKALSGAALTVALEGRLDTTTAPKLEEELRSSVDGITRLVFDVEKLEYISSAGLRVLLAMQKLVNQQGEMVLQDVNEAVMEVFEVTGFSDILSTYYISVSASPAARLRSPCIGPAACLRRQGSRSAVFLYGC